VLKIFYVGNKIEVYLCAYGILCIYSILRAYSILCIYVILRAYGIYVIEIFAYWVVCIKYKEQV